MAQKMRAVRLFAPKDIRCVEASWNKRRSCYCQGTDRNKCILRGDV